jgi:hypothetical protein
MICDRGADGVEMLIAWDLRTWKRADRPFTPGFYPRDA